MSNHRRQMLGHPAAPKAVAPLANPMMLSDADRQQAAYRGLLQLGAQMSAASAPRVGAPGPGLGAAMGGFQQGYDAHGDRLRRQQMAQHQLARQSVADTRAKTVFDQGQTDRQTRLDIAATVAKQRKAFRDKNLGKAHWTDAQIDAWHKEQVKYRKPEKPDAYNVLVDGKWVPQQLTPTQAAKYTPSELRRPTPLRTPSLKTPEEMKQAEKLAILTRPLTESQANSGLYADRMEQANQLILGAPPEAWDIEQTVKGAVPLAANLLVSDAARNLNQAKRNFITAALRRESGAAIAPAEFATADKQYFPQPGDDPQTLKQKAENRAMAIKLIRYAAGAGYAPPGATQPEATGGMPQSALDDGITPAMWATMNATDRALYP